MKTREDSGIRRGYMLASQQYMRDGKTLNAVPRLSGLTQIGCRSLVILDYKLLSFFLSISSQEVTPDPMAFTDTI